VEFFNASISSRREEGVSPISEGERSTWGGCWFLHEGATGGCSSTVATNSWSRVASGLTQGGRQPVKSAGLKGCLGQILLWRLNRLPKWNGLGKKDS
jgi:hypothetical protein